jgi:hypothetical protein
MAIGLSAAVTIAWFLAAGLFATALPGDVAALTAIYAGMSLPATIALAVKKPLEIEVDTIELSDHPTKSQVLRSVFLASWL